MDDGQFLGKTAQIHFCLAAVLNSHVFLFLLSGQRRSKNSSEDWRSRPGKICNWGVLLGRTTPTLRWWQRRRLFWAVSQTGLDAQTVFSH